MKIHPARFLEAARVELQKVVAFYNERIPGLGDDFAVASLRAIQQIEQHPELGSLYLAGTRRMLLQRFPISLVYRVQKDEVVILAVAHQRRRPGYWRSRA